MAAKPDLSIVIPAYNESSRIRPTLLEAQEFATSSGQWHGVEVIVVCDGCTDDTEAVLRSCAMPGLRLISYPVNRGKGYAVKTGILASRGRVVVFADADGATPIQEISQLAPFLTEGHDVAIGSRRVPGSRVTGVQPWQRRVLGRFFALATQLALGLDVADTQCGFKMFRGEVARSLFQDVHCVGFAFDLELLVLARARGLQVAEVGVEWHDRGQSTVSPWRDGLRMLGSLWMLRRHPDSRAIPVPPKAAA